MGGSRFFVYWKLDGSVIDSFSSVSMAKDFIVELEKEDGESNEWYGIGLYKEDGSLSYAEAV
jgi:hypothetical protein